MNMRLTTLATVCAVALQAALLAQAFSTVSGFIVDQSGAALPGVAVTAYNTERNARQEGVTDAYGRFELVGLAQGPYRLEAELPGFERSEQKLTLNGQNVTQDFTLQLGSLEEVVTVTDNRNGPPPLPSERFAPLPANCDSSPDRSAADSVRIGGQIRQPRKLYHVPPLYPQDAPPGVVRIEAMIGTDGLVKETTVTNDASDALARAAVDAVQQWEFDPTLLNCEAVDVRMSVTVDFR
jgi:hypothetical protein